MIWKCGSRVLLLEDSAECGDVVHVETAAGRVESGVLLEEKPHYTHSYGDFRSGNHRN